MRSLFLIVLLCASAPLSQGVHAQAGLKLDTSGCADAWASGLERFVLIELGDERTEGLLEIAVRCEGERVAIEVSERGAARTERQMDLSGTAEAVRSRVVALGIAGLVRELEVIARSAEEKAVPEPRESEHDHADEHESEHEHEREHADDQADDEAHADAHEEDEDDEGDSGEKRVELDGFLVPRVFSAAPAIVWGGGLRAQFLGPASLRIAIDVQAGTYTRQSALGDARLLSGSVGARLAWTRDFGASALGVGVGQRVGLARASARAAAIGASDAAVSGMWAGPFAFGWLDFAIAERLRLGVDVEAGVVLLPVRGRVERDDDLAVDGAFVALALQLGVQI